MIRVRAVSPGTFVCTCYRGVVVGVFETIRAAIWRVANTNTATVE